jgi:hypothetical protein
VKRLLALATIAIASYLSACGGGSTLAPPPPTGNFSNASLKGQYAFSMSGVDVVFGAYLARVGSFVADGNGNITSALEDVNSLGAGTAGIVSFTGGSYSIQSNGRGVIVLNPSDGSPSLKINMALNSATKGYLVQTDLNASTSGSLTLQNTADFVASAVTGSYVFDFSGASLAGAGAPLSIAGKITSNGAGVISSGVVDENDGSTGHTGPTQLPAGSYQLDANNGISFGRGTATFDGRSFAFYIVDGTRLKFLEEDNLAGTEGDALLQTGLIPTANSGFNGNFVFLIGGASLVNNIGGPNATVVRFNADGNGNLTAMILDNNNTGSAVSETGSSNITAATYAIDTTVPGSGRGTLTFTDSRLGGTLNYVFYLSSPAQGVIQDISTVSIGDGSLYGQSGGPFTLASLAPIYAFNWSGVALFTNTSAFEEDFVGQYAQTTGASKNISGVTDYVELGSTGKNLFTNVGISGTFTITGDGTGRNTYQISDGNTTFNFQAYFVNPNTILLICTDSSRVTVGIATQQTP